MSETPSRPADQEKVGLFINLLTSHQVRLRAFALSLIPHWADAEDVLQEANLVMWRKFDQFTPGTSFFSWACRIIHLTAKDFRKRKLRGGVQFSDDFLELIAGQTISLETELGEREELLNECISQLKEKQRQLLHLRYQQGMAVDRVAAMVQSSVKAIYQALSRTQKLLYDCVQRKRAAMS